MTLALPSRRDKPRKRLHELTSPLNYRNADLLVSCRGMTDVNIERQVSYWRAGAEADWRVGAGLVRARKTRHGLFFLHLALEKILKAHVCRSSGKLAPKIHSLPVLVDRSGIVLSDSQKELLAMMDRYNLAGRYPDAWFHPPRGRALVELVRESRKVYRCLVEQL